MPSSYTTPLQSSVREIVMENIIILFMTCIILRQVFILFTASGQIQYLSIECLYPRSKSTVSWFDPNIVLGDKHFE